MRVTSVVPTLNQAAFLPETLESLLSQRFGGEHEVLVIDGGSTDGTLDVLRGVTDPRLSWVSEPDRGQSDAINKGLARATGDVVHWLNSDDVLMPGALAAVVEAFAREPERGWLAGRCVIIGREGREIRQGVTRYKDRSLRRYSYRALLRENFLSQPAVFWRRSLGREVGGLDLSLHYCMDYDLWLRMGERGDPIVLDRVLAAFRLYQGSKSGAVNREQFDEQYRVARRHFGADRVSQAVHRLNVEKIVWAYRLMRLLRV